MSSPLWSSSASRTRAAFCWLILVVAITTTSAVAVPWLTNISGCVGSGAATLSCLTGATITVVGDDFSSFYGKQTPFTIEMPTPDWTVWEVFDPQTLDITNVQLIDNHTLVFTFSPTYAPWYALMETVFAANTPFPIYMKVWPSGAITNTVNISFAGLSPFTLSTVEGPCVQLSPLQNCIPGVSPVFLTGEWLTLPMQVEVGPFVDNDTGVSEWIPCTPWAFDGRVGTQWSVLLSPAPEARAGEPIFVRVSRLDQETVWTQPLSITDQPVLSYAIPCVDSASTFLPQTRETDGDGNYFSLKCQPGQRLLFIGHNLPTTPAALTLQLLTYSSKLSPSFLECSDVQVINSTSLSCLLPTIPPTWPTFVPCSAQLQVVNSSHTNGKTNSLGYMTVYDASNAPRVNEAYCGDAPLVSGSSILQPVMCAPSAVLHLSVSWVDGSNHELLANQVQIKERANRYTRILDIERTAFFCTDVEVQQGGDGSSLNVSCIMPDTATLQYTHQQVLPFLLQQDAGNGLTLTSNAVYIAFTLNASLAFPSSSSSGGIPASSVPVAMGISSSSSSWSSDPMNVGGETNGRLSPGLTAVVTISVVLGSTVLAAAIVYLFKRNRLSTQQHTESLDASLAQPPHQMSESLRGLRKEVSRDGSEENVRTCEMSVSRP